MKRLQQIVGEEVGVGSTAKVFAIDDKKVAKVYKESIPDEEYLKNEFSIMNYLHEKGFPVPKPYCLSEVVVEGKVRKALIMERVYGELGDSVFDEKFIENFDLLKEYWQDKALKAGVKLYDFGVQNVIVRDLENEDVVIIDFADAELFIK